MQTLPYVSAAQHWYTDGTLIGITGIMVGIIAIIVAVALWRFGTPRGVLDYSMPTSKALISRSPQLKESDLQIKVRGKVAQDPHLVTVRLVNSGHRDIRSDDFDRQKALVLRLGVPILDILSSADEDDQSFELSGDEELELTPTLIRRGRHISVNILTEGKPNLSCFSSLADVKVRLQPGAQGDPDWLSTTGGTSILGLLIGMVLWGVGSYINSNVLALIGLLLAIVAGIGVTSMLSISWRYAYARRKNREKAPKTSP
jgi:hypothetical protein